MLKVGITGGIGSGKTTACQIFANLGIPIYYADDRAKFLMVNNQKLMASIRGLFGSDAYFDDGQLNRKYLSQIIFSKPEMREQLNKLVHPVVWEDGQHWQQENSTAPYTLKEAAILFESGGHTLLDKIIVITAPLEIRLSRVMKRDGLDRKKIRQRMNAQMPETEKVALADYVIYNDGKRLLIPQVWDIHKELLEVGKSRR